MADLDRLTVKPAGTVLLWQQQPVTSEQARRVLASGVIMATSFRAQHHDVLLVVFCDQRFATIGGDLPGVGGVLTDGGSTTVLICHPMTETADPLWLLPASSDARIVMAMGPEFIGQHPLIDPLASTFRWPDESQVRILAMRQAARDAVRRLRARAAVVGGDAAAADPALAQASRLHDFLTSPST